MGKERGGKGIKRKGNTGGEGEMGKDKRKRDRNKRKHGKGGIMEKERVGKGIERGKRVNQVVWRGSPVGAYPEDSWFCH